MATAASAARTPPRPHSPGLLITLLGLVVGFLLWLVLSLLASIVVEWAGMLLGWWESGDGHARAMLERELRYLNHDFVRSLISSSPARFAGEVVAFGHHWLFEATGISRALAWLATDPGPDAPLAHSTLHDLYVPLQGYGTAAVAVTHLFLVRLAILILASPVFLLVALVALVDGLGQRDLRRWSGGRESSFLYHTAKAFIRPTLIGAWVIYLALPVSVHPNYVVLPFAALFGLSVAVTASAFKKYL